MKDLNKEIFVPEIGAARVGARSQQPQPVVHAELPEAALRKHDEAERIADETIELFPQLADAMSGLCVRLVETLGSAEGSGDFLRLIDGLQALAEAVSAVRSVKKIGDDRRISFLEADLLSTLKDLLAAREGNHFEFMREIIASDLQENLEGWRIDGYAAIKAAPYRDSDIAPV